MTNQRLALLPLLFIISALLLLSSCNRIPFLPRLEIDSFPEGNDSIETMEVKGVVYTRVVNPQAALDPEAPPALWVPATVYRNGKYLAYTVDLPKLTAETELANDSLSGDPDTDPQAAAGTGLEADATREEQLTETPPTIPSLRRRALLFPSRTSLQHPEIATLLSLELENKLPLRVADCHDQTLLDRARMLNQCPEISGLIKTWLKNSSGAPTVQFIIFLTTSPGRNYQYHTCTWVDAQTGNNVASFTFRATLSGQLLQPLVPNDPVPLLRLIDSTPWWCRIIKRDKENLYVLEAGHRSDLRYGRELQVFRRAALIKDPENKKNLGFFFTEPVGFVTVVDFFGADGSLAQARTPLSDDFNQAYAVKISETEENTEK
ncbi:MAG: hypothetical protein KAI69_03015 [Deltaproteobacteria bacterium]|nr:hypothetical protein [Deltaproteobacteria bacterium]